MTDKELGQQPPQPLDQPQSISSDGSSSVNGSGGGAGGAGSSSSALNNGASGGNKRKRPLRQIKWVGELDRHLLEIMNQGYETFGRNKSGKSKLATCREWARVMGIEEDDKTGVRTQQHVRNLMQQYDSARTMAEAERKEGTTEEDIREKIIRRCPNYAELEVLVNKIGLLDRDPAAGDAVKSEHDPSSIIAALGDHDEPLPQTAEGSSRVTPQPAPLPVKKPPSMAPTIATLLSADDCTKSINDFDKDTPIFNSASSTPVPLSKTVEESGPKATGLPDDRSSNSGSVSSPLSDAPSIISAVPSKPPTAKSAVKRTSSNKETTTSKQSANSRPAAANRTGSVKASGNKRQNSPKVVLNRTPGEGEGSDPEASRQTNNNKQTNGVVGNKPPFTSVSNGKPASASSVKHHHHQGDSLTPKKRTYEDTIPLDTLNEIVASVRASETWKRNRTMEEKIRLKEIELRHEERMKELEIEKINAERDLLLTRDKVKSDPISNINNYNDKDKNNINENNNSNVVVTDSTADNKAPPPSPPNGEAQPSSKEAGSQVDDATATVNDKTTIAMKS